MLQNHDKMAKLALARRIRESTMIENKSLLDRLTYLWQKSAEDWFKWYFEQEPKREALVKMATEGPKTTYKPVFVKKRTKPAKTKKRGL